MFEADRQDTDFIGFTFDGVHSIRDLNIYRTSDGSRYNNNLAPTITDKTMEIPGNDGMYFFNSFHKQKQLSVNIAFDHLTESNLRRMRQLFDGKRIAELVFDEEPYKVYSAKITGTPSIKTICFENETSTTLERVYKGEGTLQFTCYTPYAHTPTKVWNIDYNTGEYKLVEADGKLIDSYPYDVYQLREEWAEASGLFGTLNNTYDPNSFVVNCGDIDAPFVVTVDLTKTKPEEAYEEVEGTNVFIGFDLAVGDNKITILEECNNITWDSRTGLVSTSETINGNTEATVRTIKYSGVSCGTIPANGIVQTLKNIKNSEIDYQYWYY